MLHRGSYPADAYSHAVPPGRHPTVTGPYRRDIVPSFPPSASAQHDIQLDLIIAAIEANGRTDFGILATADVYDLLLFSRSDHVSRVPPPPPPSA